MKEIGLDIEHRGPDRLSDGARRKIGRDAANFSRVCIDVVVVERSMDQWNALTDGVPGRRTVCHRMP